MRGCKSRRVREYKGVRVGGQSGRRLRGYKGREGERAQGQSDE